MRIYLPDIKRKQGEAVRFRFSGPVPENGGPGKSGAADGFKVELNARFSGDQVIVGGTLEASFDTECSRCLQPVRRQVKSGFQETFFVAGGVAAHEDSAILAVEAANELQVTGDYLHLDEYLRQVYLLAREDNPLCMPECKGFCAGCGADLNRAACRCPAETGIDIRLSKLKELISDS